MNKEKTNKKAAVKHSAQKKPDFDAVGNKEPILLQLNPEPVLLQVKPNGQWEQKPPDDVDKENLKSIVSKFINSNVISAAQSYCTECNKQNQEMGGTTNYVPVIMMPILPADQYPFELDSKEEKEKEMEKYEQRTPQNVGPLYKNQGKVAEKTPKRRFVLQRFTNFDLESQW